MREINFRAWDKRFKRMSFGAGALLLRINETDFSEPMQYTGLKDKNGMEVWEGDIIEFDRDEWGGNGNIFVVKWDSKGGAWNFGGGGSWEGDFSFRQVIGNIYENPELLTQPKEESK